MTYNQENHTLPTEYLNQIIESGLAYIPELIRVMFNTAMLAEREQYLGASAYERSDQRKDYANGFKPKTVATTHGNITFDIPQVRDGAFYPSTIEKGMRSERALKIALAEMYVQGVSTRKVKAITEKLCGIEISSTQVSRATAELDPILDTWRERPLGTYRYLYFDARYEKVRQAGIVQDAAVLIAVGVNESGKREVLGISVSLSEAEVHWRDFFQSLIKRGLTGAQLITSDAHSGLKAARKAVFSGVPWQRCQFHLQQNAQAYVPKQSLKTEVAAGIRAVFNASDRLSADTLLSQLVEKYRADAPQLSDWLELNVPESLTVFAFPEKHRSRLRTTNGLERLNREIRRRTRVAVMFPNVDSCLRLVTVLVMETSEEWLTGRTYIRLE